MSLRDATKSVWPLVALFALGCARRGEVPLASGADAKVPVLVTVRFSRPGPQLEVLIPHGGPSVAHCNADCDLHLPPARYELRVTGEGPNARQRLDLRRGSTIRIRVGNSAPFAVAASVGLAGSLAALALPAALFHQLACSEGEPGTPDVSRSCNRTTTTLAIVGVAGVALSVIGIVVLRANDTRIDVEQAAAAPPPVALFEDSAGVGVRF